jgi:excisionase family DNA binding protein
LRTRWPPSEMTTTIPQIGMVAVKDNANLTARLAFSVAELPALLPLSVRTCAKLVAEGHIRSLVVGRRRLIPREAIDEFLASLEAEGTL